MIVLVVSDFHLGKGRFLRNGQLNILEDFDEDDRFAEFLDYYCSGKNYLTDIHLVLNGDILNLMQIDVDGTFSHIIDDCRSVESIKMIHSGHKKFFNSLRIFLQAPNKKITYVIGNHDSGMAFTKCQKLFKELVGESVHFCHDINISGIHIEHGHRFEVINSVPATKFFVDGPNGKKILNLPWGSLFCVSVLPILKKERPYIDKIRPMATYVKWCLFHDFSYFIKLLLVVFGYFIKTNSNTYVKHNRNFKTTFKLLKEFTLYPIYPKKARGIIADNPDVHTVVMGHIHQPEWRRFPEGKYYFNSGTWNPIPSVDTGLHENFTKLTYITIDVHEDSKTVRNASSNAWQGNWRPFREEIVAVI